MECKSLTDIVIPNSVEEIGYEAFADCTNLTKVTIPAKTKIGKDCFKNCPLGKIN